MATLQIRKKGERTSSAQPLLPVALVLLAGVGTTVYCQSGTESPDQLAHQVRPMIKSAANQLLAFSLEFQTFHVAGRAWKVVLSPFPVRFPASEMVPEGRDGRWQIEANRVQGVPQLSLHAHAFDRLYVSLGQGRYAALRWRDVPNQ
ncbi:MAG TPA: hypothetical protein V6D47_17425 [Oscillatoriaceae cyanobacterium]